jgi:hypothetical protein
MRRRLLYLILIIIVFHPSAELARNAYRIVAFLDASVA